MTSAESAPLAADPMLPVPYRVASRTAETHDCVTLRLEPARDPLAAFQPGQFSMLAVPGVGEVAISISGDPATQDGTLSHTVRAVGAVSAALHSAPVGSLLGVRGPFGTTWDLASASGRDLVIVAGGVGLAPLRPVMLGALAGRGVLPQRPLDRRGPDASRFLVPHRAGGLVQPPRHRGGAGH